MGKPTGLDDQRRSSRGMGKLGIGAALAAILVVATALRLMVYGDPRLAIATTDTQSYIDASRAPLLSKESVSGRRLITTNLLFKIVSEGAGCGPISVSMPAVGEEKLREIQPCYDIIAVLQTVLSVAAWLWLAIVIARHLGAPLTKLLAAAIILLFAFTPQIAEWDSIMGSESLTLSLFILSFGFLIEIAFSLSAEGDGQKAHVRMLYIGWFISFALWLFVRDANLYAIPATLMLMIPAGLSGRLKDKGPLGGLAILLVVLLVVGLRTSRESPRWPPSIQHSLDTFVFPNPDRTRFLSERFGMPDPNSPEYQTWFDSRAPSAFAGFLAAHPRFVVNTIVENWTVFSHSYEQPYYELSCGDARAAWPQLGEMLHPDSGVFYLVDTLLLIALGARALISRARADVAWAVVAGWLYAVGAVTLVLSYFGDTDGVMRHIFPSLEMLRLLMWCSILIFMDRYVKPPEAAARAPLSEFAGR